MNSAATNRLILPIDPYVVSGYAFGQRLRRRLILWATHLGDDIVTQAGVPVHAVGDGEVVWSKVHEGAPEKRSWGGLVIVKHVNHSTKFPIAHFYSLYGHITDLTVLEGEAVKQGQPLGVVAAGTSPENGWWETPHLHFSIYVGPWRARVLPGYARPDDWIRLLPRRTRRAWWYNPQKFITEYNA